MGATIGGGVGLLAAGIAMINDNNLNTYHKTLAVPLVLAISAGALLGTFFTYDSLGSVRMALGGAAEGIRVGSGYGAVISAILTGIQGSRDVVKKFGKRWEPKKA